MARGNRLPTSFLHTGLHVDVGKLQQGAEHKHQAALGHMYTMLQDSNKPETHTMLQDSNSPGTHTMLQDSNSPGTHTMLQDSNSPGHA